MQRTDLIRIAEAGILAPSADNNHHFRIELGDDTLLLHADADFRHGTAAHRRFLSLISFGAVVENMALRAGSAGFATDTCWDLGPGAATVATLRFAPASVGTDPLAAAIGQRHTNRRMYRGPALDPAAKAMLAGAMAAGDAATVHWLAGPQRRRAESLIRRAETERFRRRALHEELFDAIRFDLDWKSPADWSLSPASLEVEPPARPVFKAVRRWSTMRLLNIVGAHYMFGLRAGYLPARQAPDLAVLSTTLRGDAGAAAAGRAFERLWLQATVMGLALQPMAASTALIHEGEPVGGASEALREDLARGWRQVVGDGLPCIAFRLGRADPPSMRAGRRPLADYVIEFAQATPAAMTK